MICQKCGTEMRAGAVFCHVCGSRAEVESTIINSAQPTNSFFQAAGSLDDMGSDSVPVQNNVQTPSNSQFQQMSANTAVQNVEVTTKQENVAFEKTTKKKSALKVCIITAIILVVTTAVALGAEYYFNFFGLFSDPDSELQDVLNDKLDDFAGDVAESFTACKSAFNVIDKTVEGEIKFTFGDGMKEMFTSELSSEIPAEILPMLNWINSIGYGLEATVSKDAFQAEYSISANDTDITTFELTVDTKNEYGYISLPELNSTAIRIPMEGSMAAYSESMQGLEQISAVFEMLPDEEAVKNIINRYGKIIISELKDAQKSEETLTVSNVSSKCSLYTVKFTENNCINIAKAFLNELKNDEDIQNTVDNIGTSLGVGNISHTFTQVIEEAQKELEQYTPSQSSSLNLTVKFWIDSDDNIAGFGIADEQGLFEFMYTDIVSGDDVASCISLSTEGLEAKIEEVGTVSNGKFNGTTSVVVAGTEYFTIKTTDYDITKAEEGMINGKFEFGFSPELVSVLRMTMGSDAEILRDITVALECVAESENSADIAISIHQNNKHLFTLSVASSVMDSRGITIPANYIDENAGDEERAAWFAEFDINKLVSNLKSAGLPSDYAEILKLMIMESFAPMEITDADSETVVFPTISI